MEQQWKNLRLSVLDTETTGLNPEEDRVIEIGIAIFENGVIVDQYQSLIDPERDLPEEVVRITGIQPDQLVGAPKFAEVADEIIKRLKGHVLVAYNLSFDQRFLQAEFGRLGIEWPNPPGIDPLVFVRELHRGQGSKRLGAAAARLGIEHDDQHRALSDAIIAGKVLLALADQLPTGLDDVITLQNQWAIKQKQEMSMWRKGRDDRLESDTGPVTMLDDDGYARLGPAFLYGNETDPLRHLFSLLQ